MECQPRICYCGVRICQDQFGTQFLRDQVKRVAPRLDLGSGEEPDSRAHHRAAFSSREWWHVSPPTREVKANRGSRLGSHQPRHCVTLH